MPDRVNSFLERFRKFVDHNRWAVGLTAIALLTVGGCTFLEAKIDSIVDPNRKVNLNQFEAEVSDVTVKFEARAIELKSEMEAFAKKVQMSRDELYRQQTRIDQFMGALTTAIGTYVPGLDPNIWGLVGAGLGVGTIIDNRRKDRVIENREEEIDELKSKLPKITVGSNIK